MKVLQQQLPFVKMQTEITFPKIILFLTEAEYEMLGIDFDVNQVYEVELKNQSITFKKARNLPSNRPQPSESRMKG